MSISKDRQSSLLTNGADVMESTLPARVLERVIGKPVESREIGDLIDVVRSRHIRMVSLMHVGGDGWLKTPDFVPRNDQDRRDILEGGERADGSSLFAGKGMRAEASDMLLRPRMESAFLRPVCSVSDSGLVVPPYWPGWQSCCPHLRT